MKTTPTPLRSKNDRNPLFASFVFILLFINFFMMPGLAEAGKTEASNPAFCECDEPDAFPGVAQLYTREELDEIKSNFTNIYSDHRDQIDRTEARYKQLNAIGQLVFPDGSRATGVLVSPRLIITNAHAAEKIGMQVTFNVGQTPEGAAHRWADTATGVVVARGDFKDIKDDNNDWALIQLPDTSLTNKYGYIRMDSFSNVEEIDRLNLKQGFMTAGFPSFKDPKYLWGQYEAIGGFKDKVEYETTHAIAASTSSGMSGGAVLYELREGYFILVSLIRGTDLALISHKNRFSFSNNRARVVNFMVPEFKKPFKEAFKLYYY